MKHSEQDFKDKAIKSISEITPEETASFAGVGINLEDFINHQCQANIGTLKASEGAYTTTQAHEIYMSAFTKEELAYLLITTQDNLRQSANPLAGLMEALGMDREG